MRKLNAALVVITLIGCLSCKSVPVERRGAPQQLVVSRVYPADLQTLRAAILTRFGDKSKPLALPFRTMRVIELKPPNYPPEWLSTWSDPGGFLKPYQSMPASLRIYDLLIEEPIGDTYWSSEYLTAAGPARFRCGFIVHLSANAPSGTEVQVYEKVPEIWAGEHWEFLHEGIGIGKVHDIRFVEPTVKDRLDVLNLLSEIGLGG